MPSGASRILLVLARSPATYLLGLPILASLPQLIGLLHADPLLRTALLTIHPHGAPLPGVPVIDPNDGVTTQALGTLAARDWLHGIVPWWNPFSGVGMPLAGEYQPAAFFPLVLLQLLPNGMLIQHIVLQVIAGWGGFALLRQLGLGRLSATTGGVLYGFNGSLILFNHAPALPVPFLPWTLLGIERLRARNWDGWPLLALALALSVLGGFPETAYLDGLLALAWAVLRFVQGPSAGRLRFAARLALALAVALALSAPQILAFARFLPEAVLGGHGRVFGEASIPATGIVTALIAPFAFGPIYSFIAQWPRVDVFQGQVGGYASLAVVALALFGLLARRSALGWMLGAWAVLALGRVFGLPPVLALWNLVPGLSRIAAFRYLAPSWELALVILAAFGIEAASRHGARIPGRAFVAAACAGGALFLAGVALVIAAGAPVTITAMRGWVGGAMLTAGMFAGASLLLLRQGRALALACVVAGEAVLLAFLTGLSTPAHAVLDESAVRFLRANVGLNRFYTLGPFQPNYGAFFGGASINHNYLPVARRWADWVRANLDPAADPVVFTGSMGHPGGEPEAAEAVRRHLASFEWAGVEYVIAHARSPIDLGSAVTRAYADPLLAIYRLPEPAPYFEVVAGDCDAPTQGSRTRAVVDCRTPGILVRRELFFPGWSATVDGAPARIEPYRDLFQSVALAPGRNAVRFSFAPPGAGLAWLAMALGTAVLGAGWWHAARGYSAAGT